MQYFTLNLSPRGRPNSFPTARGWLRKRNSLGSPAARRTRKLASRLGRPYTVSKDSLQAILDPSHPSHGLRYPEIVHLLPGRVLGGFDPLADGARTAAYLTNRGS
jgi:hypothetical protein